ncbi:hypothetical protein B0H14DRAFT_2572503 [Mycena olivaceomarginata]|nr:hypothetical protein B0H14DRAFT_2572503 [Mycena olivaceomarginata]
MAFIVDFYLFSLFPPSLLLLETALHAHAIVPLSSPKCSSLVMARFSRYLQYLTMLVSPTTPVTHRDDVVREGSLRCNIPQMRSIFLSELQSMSRFDEQQDDAAATSASAGSARVK